MRKKGKYVSQIYIKTQTIGLEELFFGPVHQVEMSFGLKNTECIVFEKGEIRRFDFDVSKLWSIDLNDKIDAYTPYLDLQDLGDRFSILSKF